MYRQTCSEPATGPDTLSPRQISFWPNAVNPIFKQGSNFFMLFNSFHYADTYTPIRSLFLVLILIRRYPPPIHPFTSPYTLLSTHPETYRLKQRLISCISPPDFLHYYLFLAVCMRLLLKSLCWEPLMQTLQASRKCFHWWRNVHEDWMEMCTWDARLQNFCTTTPNWAPKPLVVWSGGFQCYHEERSNLVTFFFISHLFL